MFGLNDNNQQDSSNSKPDDGAPAMPANPFGGNDAPITDSSLPAPQTVNPPPEPAGNDSQSSPGPAGSNDDLIDLKQQALQNLQPLVSHLEQSPEEKFKTTMMLIQATDNSSLVKQAYEAANQITDEKARAQALLDVVNEINYFTHHKDEADSKPN